MQLAKVPKQSDPPFLPLEENPPPTKGSDFSDHPGSDDPPVERESGSIRATTMRWLPKLSGKKVVAAIVASFVVVVVFESFLVEPEDRLIPPDFSEKFLLWVQSNPRSGLWAISIVIAIGVVTMVPVGTPLTIGCGYIYRGLYGWKLGMFVATAVSMSGSCLGAVVCFLVGRYLMRETVQKWVRRYPLFDAIDVAASNEGCKIMSMLYLTPVLPLGLVSYMCGTTSMRLVSFVAAKIASLPLYLLYTFIGASAHSFLKKKGGTTAGGGAGDSVASALEGTKQMEENRAILVAGLLLSSVMMTLITRHIRKELMQILEHQKRDKNEKCDVENGERLAESAADDGGIEMGSTARRRAIK